MTALPTAARRPPLARGNYQTTLGALALGAVVYGLLQCLVVPALPAIQRPLHASPGVTSWLVTGFLLSASVAMPILGRLGDMYGKERLLLIALGAVTVGSVVSATATSIGVMIAGRVVQGISAGVFPLAFAIIRDEFPRDRVATGLGRMSSLLGVGSGLGVLLAGPIVAGLGYRWLFWVPAIVAAIAAVATWAYIPESPIKTKARVDWVGGLLMSVGLGAFLLAISRASAWGWTSPRTLALVGFGILMLLAWIRVELVTPEPLVDMRMMRIRSVWTTNLATSLIGVGMFAAFILLPQFVAEPQSTGYGFGASITQAGVFLLPMTTMLLIVGSQTGRFERRLGPRVTLTAATAVSFAAWLLLVLAHSSPWQIYLASGIAGAGNGLALAATPMLITASVSRSQTGVANGMNNVMRTVGGAVGAQIAATLLAHNLVAGRPSEHGYELAFLMGAIALAVAFAISFAVPDAGPGALEKRGSAE